MALWEVFIRPRRGLAHSHVGSVHAADAHRLPVEELRPYMASIGSITA